MKRRKFLSVTGSLTGGTLLLPQFLNALGGRANWHTGQEAVVFIQLSGGNDGLNTFIPYKDPLYFENRPKIALSKNEVIGKNKGMAFHPALKGFAEMQDAGHLTVLQNVGYPSPNRSHFRSQEIWQTASDAQEYLTNGWLGRYLDLQYADHQPTAGVNLDAIDNLALKGQVPNSLTVKNPGSFKLRNEVAEATQLSNNPQLDFVRKIATSITEGSEAIQDALGKAQKEDSYPKSGLAKKLSWIARLIKGQLNTKVYYTSLGGFDTHDYQLDKHKRQLAELNGAVHAYYKDLKKANLLSSITIVVFSEFGRRVADNGRGTDHGTAAPMFIIGGNNQGRVIGDNPNLTDLDQGDLKYKIDFRSVYAAILENKLGLSAKDIGISQKALSTIF